MWICIYCEAFIDGPHAALYSPLKPRWKKIEIESTSQYVVLLQARGASAHDLLYQDAAKRQLKQQEMATLMPDAYPFAPQLAQHKREDDSAADGPYGPASQRCALMLKFGGNSTLGSTIRSLRFRIQHLR